MNPLPMKLTVHSEGRCATKKRDRDWKTFVDDVNANDANCFTSVL